jgi:hypothetical protein
MAICYWKVYRLISSIGAMNTWDRVLIVLTALLATGAALVVMARY